MKIIVLDLETLQLVKDWAKPWEAGLACVGVWCNWLHAPYGREFVFDPPTLSRCIDLIGDADMLVSYNGIRFDCKFLDGYWGESEKIQWPALHCDLWELLRDALGWRLGPRLEHVARPTLGWGKSGHGKQAPELAREGRWAELHSYVLDDVRIPRALYHFARKWGFLWVETGDEVQAVRISVPGAERMFQAQGRARRPATEAQISKIRQLTPWWNPAPGLTQEQAAQMLAARKGAA